MAEVMSQMEMDKLGEAQDKNMDQMQSEVEQSDAEAGPEAANIPVGGRPEMAGA